MKFFMLMAVCLALVAQSFAQSVKIIDGPKVEPSSSGAVISWKTDSACGTRLRYGTDAAKLDGRAGEGTNTEHRVEISGLTAGAKYFFSIGTSKYELSRGDFVAAKAPSKNPLRRLVDAITKPATPPPAASKPTTPATKPAAAPAAARQAPPTRKTWGNISSLADHFARHGGDFHAKDADDYARQAWEFRQRAMDEGLPAKQDDSDGSIRVWDPKTRAFASYNRDGTTKTYFKPGSPDYFQRQPGRPIKLKRQQ